jgi:TIR domain
MGPAVFVSYKSEDLAAAQRVCAGLESQNIRCWMAPRDIPAGAEWPSAIVGAINACKTFVVVLSANSKNAKQIAREAELADKQGAHIVTLRIENVEPPPELTYFLGNLQWLDAFDGQFEGAVARIAEIVREDAGEHAAAASVPKAAVPTMAAAQPVKKPAIGLVVASGALLVAAGVTAFFLMHRDSSSDMLQAKAVADRFLNERAAGQLDAAWGEYTKSFRQRIDRQKWEAEEGTRRAHGQSGFRYNGCLPQAEGYLCEYLLLYTDGHEMNQKLSLIKSGSRWLIASGGITK